MTLAANWVDFAVALVWPFFALVALAFLLTGYGRRLFAPLAVRLQSFKAGPFELALTSEAADRNRDQIETVFAQYRLKLRRAFDRLVEAKGIEGMRKQVLEELDGHLPAEWRSTIHVPDALFRDSYYQLLDYEPRGDGRGRAFSLRSGIVGLAFRAGEAKVAPDVPHEEDLIRNWAMTAREAKQVSRDRRSFLCAVLGSRYEPVAVFYLDSSTPGAFGSEIEAEPAKSLVARIVGASDSIGLTAALADLGHQIREAGPIISIFDNV